VHGSWDAFERINDHDHDNHTGGGHGAAVRQLHDRHVPAVTEAADLMAKDERPARRMGRRPLDAHDPSVNLSTRIPASRYDEFCRGAQRERVSVAEYVRRSLGIFCRRDPEGEE
jgi:hypothetical protein